MGGVARGGRSFRNHGTGGASPRGRTQHRRAAAASAFRWPLSVSCGQVGASLPRPCELVNSDKTSALAHLLRRFRPEDRVVRELSIGPERQALAIRLNAASTGGEGAELMEHQKRAQTLASALCAPDALPGLLDALLRHEGANSRSDANCD